MSVLHQYSQRNCCSGRREHRKLTWSARFVVSHFLASFFSLLSAPFSTSHLLPLTYTPHTSTQCMGLPLLITISHHPPSFLCPISPSCYIPPSTSLLPGPFLPALLPPLCCFFNCSLSLSQPCLMRSCKRGCFDLTLGLFSTSVHSSCRPRGALWGSFGVGACWLWSAVLQPVCSFRIQTWSSPLKGGGGR